MSIKFSGGKKSNRGLKAAALVLAFVVTIGASIGGTLAWLTAQTPEVTNTFTSAKLFNNDTDASSFKLLESTATDVDQDGRYTLTSTTTDKNSYKVLPGVNIPKDPWVEFSNLAQPAYLYIKVTDGLPSTLGWEIDSTNWTALDGVPGVYVYKGSGTNGSIPAGTSFTGNGKINIMKQYGEATDVYAISVPGNYGDNGDGITDKATLSFTAYMVQATGNGENAAEAWGNTYGKPATPTT